MSFIRTIEKMKDCSWYLMKTKYKGELIPDYNEGIEKCVNG